MKIDINHPSHHLTYVQGKLYKVDQLVKRKLGEQNSRRLFSGGFWTLAAKGISAVTGMLTSGILARLVSPDEMGAYFLLLTVVVGGTTLGQLGLNQMVVQQVAAAMGAGRSDQARAAVRGVMQLGFFGGLAVALLLVLQPGQWLALGIFDSPIMAGVMGLAAAWTVVSILQNLAAESFRGFHDIRLAAFTGGTIGSILTALLLSALALAGRPVGLAQALRIAIVADTLGALAAYWLLQKKLAPLPGGAPAPAVKILQRAWPQSVTNLTLFALAQASIWILGAFSPESEVAVYGATVRLITLVAMPLSLINAVVPPIVAEMHARAERQEMQRVLRSTATLAGLPAIAVLTIFILFGGPILGLIYGDYYRQGAILLLILSAGQLVNVWSGSCGIALMMTGNQKTLMLITLASGAATIAGSIWAAQAYGTFGIAIATAAGVIFQNIAMWLAARWKLGIWTHIHLTELRKLPNLLRREGKP